MSDASRSKQITVRVIRDGAPEPPDNDWSMAFPEERIKALWTLTELCLLGTNVHQVYRDFEELLLAFNAQNIDYL